MSTTRLSRSKRFTQMLGVLAAAGLLVSAGCKEEGDGEQTAEPQQDETSAAKATEKKGVETRASAGGESLAEIAGSYELDPAHSAVLFRAERFGISYVHGLFTEVSGSMTLSEDPSESSFEVNVNPGSLFTGVKKRDDHLKSPDFLNAKQFPELTMVAEEIRPTGDGEFEVTGELTLHGETRPVQATVTQVGAGKSPMDESKFLAGFHGELSIQRSDFGIDYMSDGIGDEIVLTVEILGVRK